MNSRVGIIIPVFCPAATTLPLPGQVNPAEAGGKAHGSPEGWVMEGHKCLGACRGVTALLLGNQLPRFPVLPPEEEQPSGKTMQITRILPGCFRGSRKEFCKGSDWSTTM